MAGKPWAAVAGVAVTLSVIVLGVATEKHTDNKAATVAENSSTKKENPTGNPTNGKKVFQANCEVCHESELETTKIGPGLKGLFKKRAHKHSSGKEHAHTVASVREQIEKGSGDMPAMGPSLSPTEIEDVIAYLQTL